MSSLLGEIDPDEEAVVGPSEKHREDFEDPLDISPHP